MALESAKRAASSVQFCFSRFIGQCCGCCRLRDVLQKKPEYPRILDPRKPVTVVEARKLEHYDPHALKVKYALIIRRPFFPAFWVSL